MAPGFRGPDASRIPSAPAPTQTQEAKGPQNAVAEAVLYPDSHMTTAQLELALAEQQREMHMLVAHHYETARQMLVARDQISMACKIENQELRAQIGELRRTHATPNAKNHREQALVMRQQRQANKVLLTRDLQARKTEEENAILRAKLSEMATTRRPPEEAEFSASDSPSGEESTKHAVVITRSEKSVDRIPDFAMQPAAAMPPRPVSRHSAQSAPPSTGINLLMSLKLPGQVYDEGNFFPKEESSDDEDHDLPPWDAELTKRPKKAVAVMDMKERMRQMFKSGPIRFNKKYKEDGWCSYIAGHDYFETVVYAFIIANVIWLGIDAVANDQDLLNNAPAWIIVVENVFCFFFVGELLVRYGAHRSLWDAVRDPWMAVDSILVLGMILETWIFFAIVYFVDFDFTLIDQSSLRLLRVLRVSRVARIVRILRALPELLILVKALGVATRSVFFTFCLLFIVIYLFALACTIIGKDTASGERHFRTLGQSMFTLFFYGLFGYDLATIAESAFADNVPLGVVFCVYLVCAPLTMMNLLVAVLVEVVGVLATAEQEMVNTQYEQDQMTLALGELDENGDEFITLEEFGKLMDKREALIAMRELGVDVLAIVEAPELIFGQAESLSFSEFTETALALRDANTATVRDINQLAKRMIGELRGTVGQLNSKIKKEAGSKDKLNLKNFQKKK